MEALQWNKILFPRRLYAVIQRCKTDWCVLSLNIDHPKLRNVVAFVNGILTSITFTDIGATLDFERVVSHPHTRTRSLTISISLQNSVYRIKSDGVIAFQSPYHGISAVLLIF
jgi:hypothetical protein